MSAKNPDCDDKANILIFASILGVPLLLMWLWEPLQAVVSWFSKLLDGMSFAGAPEYLMVGLMSLAAYKWAEFLFFKDDLARDWLPWFSETAPREAVARMVMCMVSFYVVLLFTGLVGARGMWGLFGVQAVCMLWWIGSGRFRREWDAWNAKAFQKAGR